MRDDNVTTWFDTTHASQHNSLAAEVALYIAPSCQLGRRRQTPKNHTNAYGLRDESLLVAKIGSSNERSNPGLISWDNAPRPLASSG